MYHFHSACIYLFRVSPLGFEFYFFGGGENKKGRGRAASYCHSDYILLQGKRSSGTQVLPSLYLPSQGRIHLSNVLKKTLMVSRGLGLEMSDAGLFFPESTHSLVGEANMGIISIIILPARMKYVNQRYKWHSEGTQLKDFTSDIVERAIEKPCWMGKFLLF